jgi:hypothetical protein
MKWAVGAVLLALAFGPALLWLLAFPGALPDLCWPQQPAWGGGPQAPFQGVLGQSGCEHLASGRAGLPDHGTQ